MRRVLARRRSAQGSAQFFRREVRLIWPKHTGEEVQGPWDEVIRDPERCLDGAVAAVLATEWGQFRDLEPEDFLRMRGRVVVDTRRVYDPGKFGAAGIRLIQLGRGSSGIPSPTI